MAVHFLPVNMHLSSLCCHWSFFHPLPPPPCFFVLHSLPPYCLSHYRAVKFILIPPFRQLTVHATFYLSWTVEIINLYWRSISRGINYLGSEGWGHMTFYLRFCNYSPRGKTSSWCIPPKSKAKHMCTYMTACPINVLSSWELQITKNDRF